MLIETNNGWCKRHVVHGIKKVCSSELKQKARELDAYEFGVYRGECTQLIDNLFYAYQFPIRKIFGIDSFEGLPEEEKSVERFYLFNKGMFADVNQLYPLRPNGQYIKSWFNDLSEETVQKFDMKPAAFVHIDGDLYISAKQAFTWLFTNNLVIPGTIIGFDEFKSTSTLEAGGESKAWFEICEEFKIDAEEFYRNAYRDRIECWQSSVEIISIGERVNPGVYI